MKLATPGSTPSTRLWQLPTWLLNHVAGTGRRLVFKGLEGVGERNRYAVLAALAEFGPVSQIELVRRVGIDRSDMVGLLNHLEGNGLVTRTPDLQDRRRKHVALTNEGARALRTLDDLVDRAQEDLLAPLSEDERARFIDYLQRLLQHHEEYHPADPAPGDAR